MFHLWVIKANILKSNQLETVGLQKSAPLLHKRQNHPCDLFTLSRSFEHHCSHFQSITANSSHLELFGGKFEVLKAIWSYLEQFKAIWSNLKPFEFILTYL